ncbi:MAG: translation initiation factor Sui1 [Planctomycetota bacterium]|nr:translation initiation factor Sui1 [Planctomycetota bacterium]
MSQSRRVYSTDHGRMCPACNRLITACRCKQARPKGPPSDGIVRVSRSTKGRKGKGVTVITGVPLEGDALKKLAKQLKAACGAGGAIKDGAIEIQGDHRDSLVEALKAKGWTVKRAGG